MRGVSPEWSARSTGKHKYKVPGTGLSQICHKVKITINQPSHLVLRNILNLVSL